MPCTLAKKSIYIYGKNTFNYIMIHVLQVALSKIKRVHMQICKLCEEKLGRRDFLLETVLAPAIR